jgi:hypothetical protein
MAISTDLKPSPKELIPIWTAAWPKALAVWSRFTRLRDARLCTTHTQAAAEGLTTSFAMIRLADQSVVIDLERVQELGLQDYAIEILAHEIGHHVLAPGSATDQFRLLARIRRALPTLENQAPLVANLYMDLYINDRLQRQSDLRMGDIYIRLAKSYSASKRGNPGQVWTLYMAIYEQLWRLEEASLCAENKDAPIDEHLKTDAWLGARLIRVYANDWMNGAGKFATLLLPYLVEDANKANTQDILTYLHDTQDAAQGCEPSGAQEVEVDELEGGIHPANDARVSGREEEEIADSGEKKTQSVAGQTREPFEYGEILKAAGITLSDHEIAVRYYRERALPHIVAFPMQVAPQSTEPQLEALEPWEIGDSLEDLDWMQSILQSPRPIPGLTTVRRLYGDASGKEVAHKPINLDMYVDSSGSMPNPQRATSFLTLAGAIIAMSALRAGSKVQVTLWSGKHQVEHTDGFIHDDTQILRVLTGFYGGATCFPIHRLRDTYAQVKPGDNPTHILMISDDGITTMFDQDERGNSGWDIAARALAAGAAGGTMALNLPTSWDWAEARRDLKRARSELGWQIHAINKFEDLIDFACAFSRHHYGKKLIKDATAF